MKTEWTGEGTSDYEEGQARQSVALRPICDRECPIGGRSVPETGRGGENFAETGYRWKRFDSVVAPGHRIQWGREDSVGRTMAL